MSDTNRIAPDPLLPFVSVQVTHLRFSHGFTSFPISYAGFASPTGQKRLKSKELDAAVLLAKATEADL